MSLIIPTTQEIAASNVANYEAQLSQTSPLNSKAFLRVTSAIEAMGFTALYKYAVNRAKQNLILTAAKESLDLIGIQYNVIRKPETPAILTGELPGEDGTTIGVNRSFVAQLTGLRYSIQNEEVIAGGIATMILTAHENGINGNLDVGAKLEIDSPEPGAQSILTVTVVNQIGVNAESDDDYRIRVLDAARATGGGGNSSDYRNWAQETVGVKRAYPYAGKPVALLAESAPPERTVYVEAVSTVDPDGIAPQSLLDDVRATITTDPVTGKARQPLGLTDETLFIESITRLGFYVVVRGMLAPPAFIAQIKTDIESALELYFSTIQSFVPGLDPAFDRNDTVTDLTVSAVIENILSSNGATAISVGFGLNLGSFIGTYSLSPGELSKLIQVDFE